MSHCFELDGVKTSPAMNRLAVVAVALAVALMASSCGPKVPEPVDPCAGVSCGEGRCAVVSGAPACLCNEGFTATGLSCVARPPVDLCASNPCANLSNSLCQVTDGRVACVCPASRVEVNGSCVVRTACTPNPCMVARRTTCEVVGGAASCVCDPGFAPEGDGCAAMPVWRCSAQHGDGDAAEPDECPLLARPLSIDVDESRTLFPAGDHDWFELGVTDGHLFSFSATSSSMPLLIEVYAHDGVTLIASDNRGAPAAQIAFVAPGPESVMVRVRAVRATDTGSYTVRYSELGIDDYANDTSTAITLVAGANPFSGTVQYAGDQDVVWLEVPGGTALRLSTPDAGTPDVVVELSRPDGGARTLNPGESTTITTPALEALVLSARGRTPRTTGNFVVSFTELGADDHSDEGVFGTPIATDNSLVQGRFERAADMDTFSVEQLAGRIYRARWQGQVYSAQLSVALPGGQVIVPSYSSSGVVWEASQSKPAALRIASSYSTGTYAVAVEDLGVDDHGDTLSTATAVTHGMPVGGRLELSDDIDVFSFTGTAGRVLQVAAVASVSTGSPPALTIRVTDSTGLVVAEGQTTVGLLVASTGLFKAQVSRGSYSSASDLVQYALTVTDAGTDDHGGTSSAATALTVGTAAAGSVQYASDVDVFSFNALANHLYGVTCTRTSGSCTYVVRDGSGQQVGTSGYSQTAFLAPVAGRWTVEVNAGSTYSPTLGPFFLTVSDLGLEDHGSTIATATAVTVGTAVPGAIGYQQDVDVFSFATQAGHIYAATVTGNSSARPEVRDGSNLLIASSYNSTVSFVATHAGPYFVALTSYSVGAYTIVVTDRGADDHPNTSSGATTLTLGTPTMGEIQYQNDADFFTVPVVAGHHHLVSCSGASSCTVQVTTPTGTALASGYGSTGVTFKPPAGITSVFVRVTGTDGLRYGVTVTDSGADDHGDARADATSLVVDGPVLSGSLPVSTDVDAFLVTAAAGDIVGLSCVSTAGSACGVSIFTPSGSTIASGSSSAVTLRTGFLASAAGAYLVLVRGSANSAFTLAATRTSDDFTTVTPFTLGTPRTGSLDYVGDTDVFTITLTQGVLVRLSLSSGARATITSPTGGYVPSLYGGYMTSYTPTATGTYTFTIATDTYYGALVDYTLTAQ